MSAIYHIGRNNTALAIVSVLARMYFDYADGMFARQYGMSSDWGDMYDHCTDLAWFAGTVYVLARVLPVGRQRIVVFSVLALFTLLSCVQLACIESACHSEGTCANNATLSVFRPLEHVCSAVGHDTMQWFDNSLMFVALIGIIVYRRRFATKVQFFHGNDE